MGVPHITILGIAYLYFTVKRTDSVFSAAICKPRLAISLEIRARTMFDCVSKSFTVFAEITTRLSSANPRISTPVGSFILSTALYVAF